MTAEPDRLEWVLVRIGLGLAALIVVAVGAGWKVHDLRQPPAPTKLESSIRCLNVEKEVVTIVPTGDLLADSATEGSFKTTIEGNEVTVALAASEEEAARIERYYNDVAGDLEGRLERRQKTVYLWKYKSSSSQRQVMYDCGY